MDNPAERLLADTEKALRKLVEDGTLDIAVLCERGRRYGREFSYPRIQGLDGEVNRALVALSDRCMEKTSEMMRDAVRQAGLGEADEDSVLEWVRSSRWGEGEQERSDSYCSHLKYILEGWLAIGFARKWSSAYIASRAASDADPYTTPEWRAAFRENGWAPDIISSGGYRWGKGVPVSPAKGIALGAGAMVMSAYSHSELVGYGRSGATGYRVRRGSNYPCALCDSLCGITWPISVEVLPAHPHCVCYAEPVYDRPAGSQKGSGQEAAVRERAKEIREMASSFAGTTIKHPATGMEMTLSRKGIKEWLNQPHVHYGEKNEMLLRIDDVLRDATYLGYGPDKHNPLAKAHLFETSVAGDKSWIVVIEDKSGRRIHSISDSSGILKALK